jgi:hypothetical protein
MYVEGDRVQISEGGQIRQGVILKIARHLFRLRYLVKYSTYYHEDDVFEKTRWFRKVY